jgi:hypothetical protein
MSALKSSTLPMPAEFSLLKFLAASSSSGTIFERKSVSLFRRPQTSFASAMTCAGAPAFLASSAAFSKSVRDVPAAKSFFAISSFTGACA